MSDPLPRALTIAGSDPTGGAGLQLDVQVFALHGVHGMAVPSALTVQSLSTVQRTLPVFPNVVGEMLELLLAELPPVVIKTGMLGTDDVVLRVANVLERHADPRLAPHGAGPIPRVVDPVLRASDGAFLLERRAWGNLMDKLVAGCTLVTPNLFEAEALTGFADPERAARAFLECGAEAALIKGGHADGAPDDFLLTADQGVWLRGQRREGGPVHGTGCALSAAITARLARGEKLLDAVRAAKSWLANAIEGAQRESGDVCLLQLGRG